MAAAIVGGGVMFATCTAPHDLGMIRALLNNVDCNVRLVTEGGYQALSAPDSQLASALTAAMTIYVAVLGFRLLLGMAPLRVGDLTMTAIKLGAVLALATNWPTYQQVVFDALFHGPEQLAASMTAAIQPADSLLRGNPFDGLQIGFDQMQAGASFFTRISSPVASPLTGGPAFAGLALNLASYLAIFTTVGLVLTAKIVLGLLLAFGPLFIGFLLFDSTHGIFEGWLRAVLGFAFLPLFATLALVMQLAFLAPYLQSLAQAVASGQPNLSIATAVLILTLVAAMVSVAGVVGLFIVALGFKLPGAARGARPPALDANVVLSPAASAASAFLPPRVAAIGSAVHALSRRDLRLEAGEAPRRLNLGAGAEAPRRDTYYRSYRRSARPHGSASTMRRDT
jgi:type IV secretion system protein VirB6